MARRYVRHKPLRISKGICKQCGKEFTFYASAQKGLFCSYQCYGKWKTGRKLPKWLVEKIHIDN